MFDQFKWLPDRMLLDDLVFRLQHTKSENWDASEHFMFYKVEGLVRLYQKFFESRPEFVPHNIFELGIFDGGSTAFWYEVFHPEKIVAIDLLDREDNPYFRKYIASRQLEKKVRTYWRTNQADKARLLEIASQEFHAPLDLVIDDCSHMYMPTLASFEVLFPLLRPGGLYIIEDWAWGHWPDYIKPDHPWSKEEPPTTLLTQFIEAIGSTFGLIDRINVFRAFIILERGAQALDPGTFRLEDHIVRRADKAVLAAQRRKDRLANPGATDPRSESSDPAEPKKLPGVMTKSTIYSSIRTSPKLFAMESFPLGGTIL